MKDDSLLLVFRTLGGRNGKERGRGNDIWDPLFSGIGKREYKSIFKAGTQGRKSRLRKVVEGTRQTLNLEFRGNCKSREE